MPLEVNLNTVPHLKALTNGFEPSSGHGYDSSIGIYESGPTLKPATHSTLQSSTNETNADMQPPFKV